MNVYNWGEPTLRADNGDIYQKAELDFDVEDENNPNYWTRLEHTYAGMAMQGILANYGVEPLPDDAANDAREYAHALIQKLKEMEERK